MTVSAGTSGRPLSSREQRRDMLLSNWFSLGSSSILKWSRTASSLSRLGGMAGSSRSNKKSYILMKVVSLNKTWPVLIVD